MLKHYRKEKYKHGWYKRKCGPFTYFYKSKSNKQVVGLVQNNKTAHAKVDEANKISWLLSQGVVATISKPFILYRMENNYIVHGKVF